MIIHITESVWLDANDMCSFEHLVQVSGLTNDNLLDLIDAGVIKPANDDPANYSFPVSCIVLARTARRLRDDFELDSEGLALAVNLLQRIEALQSELHELRAKFAKNP
ncbi:hypothetical protein EKL30_04205 [Candidimonas sp. SYP-B2681]|uniref:chaperone modulator CbpM n=1 Tax=Candidimonas sp. SYP-B2681 TaxID=2497686 RepID=UPI000F892B2A|nr:chaperone modulator CbpM [Candidimonas sp. SYP-B2681]RTZ48161.1 hypothetical protein EKL30_04205 [Candidimonas sp. SYP-B2681]